MKGSNGIEWYEIGLCSIFGGCISASTVILYSSGFDGNAVLTLLGAFSGVATVVLITQDQDERQKRTAKRKEAKQITNFLGALKTQIRTQSTPLFDKPFDTAKAYVACQFAAMTIDQVKEYAEQVGRFAVHLDFATRAHMSSLIVDCEKRASDLRAVMAAQDAYPPSPDWDVARRSATGVQNAIEVANM